MSRFLFAMLNLISECMLGLLIDFCMFTMYLARLKLLLFGVSTRGTQKYVVCKEYVHLMASNLHQVNPGNFWFFRLNKVFKIE